MTAALRCMLVAGLLCPTTPSTGFAQSADPSPPADCAGFEEKEAAGKIDVARLIEAIDAAAEAGDSEAFCKASFDLVLVYRTIAKAAAGCDPERAQRWSDAGEASMSALTPTCR